MSKAIVRFRTAAFIQQRGRCVYCDYPMWESNIEQFSSHHRVSLAQARHFRCTAEHLKARRDGGDCSRINIVAACRRCNLRRHARKGSLAPDAYRRLVRSRLRQGGWHVCTKCRLTAGC